jgi:hypothetical protein
MGSLITLDNNIDYLAFGFSFQTTQPDIVVRTGYMYKRGGKRKNWKRRWFCLSGTFIFYYTNQNRTTHKGTILLEEAKVGYIDQGMTKFSFKIETPNRTYIMSCETEKDREDWMAQIRAIKASSMVLVRKMNLHPL